MKPISVKFKCFGPYMAEQFVDFTQLEQSGLFLICGETGAGKTTILDAMCIALYGKSSGGIRGELSDMRCKLAGKDDVTEVEFVFENGGAQYKFTRTLYVARKNETDKHQCMELRDGQWVPLFENPKKTNVNAKAEEIIGLTYDQFRQVIILPQGQFEKLLTANSDEKTPILAKLFHTERLERVVEEVNRRVKERDDALKRESEAIAAELKEYDCDSLSALEEKAAQDVQTLKDTRAEVKKAEKTLADAKKKHEDAIREDGEFQELAKREKKLAELTEKQAEFEQDEEILRLVDAADKIYPLYTAHETAQKANAAAVDGLEKASKALEEAVAALETAQSDRAAHEEARPAYEDKKKRVVLLENARELYRSLSEKKAKVDEQLELWQKAVEEKENADRDFQKADEDWNAALETQKQARTAYKSAQTSYLQGIGGILAERLTDGEPCPVCGSAEHPSPAKKVDGTVSDAELDKLSKAENDANDAEVKTRSARNEAEGRKTEATDALNKTERDLTDAQAAYTQAEAGKIDGIDTEEALDAELSTLGEEISAFEEAETTTQNALSDAESEKKLKKSEVSRLTKELEVTKTDCKDTEKAWNKALKNSLLEDEAQYLDARMELEEKQRKSQGLADFKAELKAAQDAVNEKREALKDKTTPDLDAIKQSMDEAEAAAGDLKTALALLEKELAALENDLKILIKRKKKHDEDRLTVDDDLEFATKLRGRSGVSLQRYVLGVKLSAITIATNEMLKKVYGSRFRLYRTDEVAGRTQKAGLELEVYDISQNKRRNVTTLSGGEKFLVSLSLAIGLSTVVQASGGGVHIEAMFVDEGFGSLDNKAVDEAIDMLQGVQRNAGMVVGIISHVERLEETISTKLEVKKGDHGSNIHVCC